MLQKGFYDDNIHLEIQVPKWVAILQLQSENVILCKRTIRSALWRIINYFDTFSKCSSVASRGAGGAECPPPDSEKFAENREEGGNREKSGRKGKNQEGSFTLPHLTERAGLNDTQGFF